MAKKLIVQPLTQAAFEPFGSVIEIADNPWHQINGGTAVRFDKLATVEAYRSEQDLESPQIIISLFEAKPQAFPLEVKLMERHPLGSQGFMPLNANPWLLVVSAADQAPSAENLRAFIATGNQGVNYAAGVWHHPLIAIKGHSRFLVVDRDGSGNNLEEISLRESVTIDNVPKEA